MSEMYWELFMTTGSIKDYLSYKKEQNDLALKEGTEASLCICQERRREECESDRINGHGALYDAGRGI